ncbi:hypothetical protein C7999DRAFT_30947 [Corynascus novoguineensis]|uniref:Uncharacterized protein n=1 Tax=Corynascus novoguineensis TaxID=1126955 RepID=A0AAN7HQG1_9PEZI|nr:hypothetical protein C7999DRAFT_30947 [Corynascus novoguineensis]
MRPLTSSLLLASGAFLATTPATVVAELNISPPCINDCYDNNPGPKLCDGVTDMTDEVLARCTCSSFGSEPPLYECIRACPESEQATYAAGLEEHVYQCAEDYFPDIDISSATTTKTTAAAPDPTTTASSSDSDAPAPTESPNYASRHAAPALLLGAAAGFVAALLF